MFLSLVILTLLHPFYAVAACDVTDDTGHTLHLSTPAQRIISLAPDITETLFAISAGNHIIGVVQGSDFPEAARKIPLVGSYSGLDLERIASLRPDLIVTWSQAFSRQLAALKMLGIPIYTTSPRRLEDIPHTMKNLGCLAGTFPNAQSVANQYEHRLALLHKRYHRQDELTVFYQIGTYSLITINQDSWINQAISLCGGRNIFAQTKWIAPEVSWESVITANPQVILSDANDENWTKRWNAWPTLSAVKQHFLFSVNPDLISRAGPRLLDGVEQICGYLGAVRKQASSNSSHLR